MARLRAEQSAKLAERGESGRVNEQIRDASRDIDGALKEQRPAAGGLVFLLSEVANASEESQQVAQHFDNEVQALQEQATLLRSAIKDFSV